MGSLSPGSVWLWLRAALARELHSHGSGWESNARAAKSSSLVEVRLHSSMPQVQSVVRLSKFPQPCVDVDIHAKHTQTHSHCKPHASSAQTEALSAHTSTNSPDSLMVLTSLANQARSPVIIIHIYICIYIGWSPPAAGLKYQILVSSFFHLDIRVPSAVAPLQLLAQVIAHTHTNTRSCTCAHAPSRDVTVAHTHAPGSQGTSPTLWLL